MDEQGHKIDEVASRLETHINDQNIYKVAMQRVESKLDTMLLLVGGEEEDGEGGYRGTGLLGRMRRIEQSQQSLLNKYRVWIAWGAGFVTCMGGAAVVFWWLIGHRLDVILRGAGQ